MNSVAIMEDLVRIEVSNKVMNSSQHKVFGNFAKHFASLSSISTMIFNVKAQSHEEICRNHRKEYSH